MDSWYKKFHNKYPRSSKVYTAEIFNNMNVEHSPIQCKKRNMVSLFNGISTLFRLFNAKAILLEEQ